MAGSELASAYISLIPSLQNAGKNISSQLGNVDVSGAGQKLGRQLGDNASKAFGSTSVKQLEDKVASATAGVTAAMHKQEDAAAQLAIAEQKLTETRARYKEGSSQVMSAEERVRKARQKNEAAAEGLKSAETKLKSAQEQLKNGQTSLKSSTDNASRAFDSMSAKASKGKGALIGLKGAAGLAAGVLASLGIGSLAKEAVEATDGIHKFKSTLSFAGMDTGEIEALTKSTKEYADKTIYDLTDIQNTTAQLAANAVPNYDKLAEAAGNLNAVAGGNADTFKSVGMVLTQTAGAGKLTTENWNQLANAIPGASGKLQEAMAANGAYTGNFREAMEKGEISAEEFNQAIMDLGFDEAAVAAASSTDTFEGAIGNLKASVVSGFTDILTDAQPYITNAINGITSLVAPAFDGVGKIIGFLGEQFKAIAPIAQQVITPIVNAVAGLRENFEPLIGQFMTGLMPAMQGLSAAIYSVMAAVSPLIATIISTVAPVLADVISKVMSLWTTIATMITPIIMDVAAIIAAVLPPIQAIFTEVMNAIQTVINAVWPYIEGVVTTAMTAIGGIIDAVLCIVNGDWSGAWEAIKSTASDVWSKIGTIVSDGIEDVKSFIAGIPDTIMGYFSDAGKWLLDSGKAIIQGLADGISGAVDTAVEAVKGVLTKIREWLPFSPAHKGPFSGKGWTLYSGQSIVEAMAKGALSRQSVLDNAFAGIATSAHNALGMSPIEGNGFAPSGSLAAEVRSLHEDLGNIIYANTPLESDRNFARRVNAYA